MQQIFSRNKSQLKELIFALEKLSNIASVKVSQNENEITKRILEGLEKLLLKFWALKKNSPEKYSTLLEQSDFYEEAIKLDFPQEPLKKESSDKTGLKDLFKDQKEYFSYQSRLRELKIVGRFLNSFGQIWESAVRVGNEEISAYVVYHLEYLLAELSQDKNNEEQIEQMLRFLNQITWEIIAKYSDKGVEPSIYPAAINWYTNIVFNRLRVKKKGFLIDYLPVFDRYFFASAKMIVSKNQDSIFRALVTSLVDGIHIPSYHKGKIWDYGHLLLRSGSQKYNALDEKNQIEEKIRKLSDLENSIFTKDDLDKCVKKFEELKTILEPHFTKDQKKEAEKIESEIRDFMMSQFKYKNLLETVFAIGAYCVFKQKPKYIKYLWEYKQPPDSDASWIGHDIIPNTINEVVSLYFGGSFLERKFDFWEDHHGNEMYLKQYFLLLLARIMKRIKPNPEGKYVEIENYQIPNLHVYRLSDLEYLVDSFVTIAGDIKQRVSFLEELGFNKTEIDELFNRKLIPFLQILKTKAQLRIEELHKELNISPIRVKRFKEQVIEEFDRSAVLRDIFKHYGLYVDKTEEEYVGNLERFGINIVDDKAAFFEDWHVHFGDWGENYGKSLASGENSYLLERIAESCREIRENQFEDQLGKFDDMSNIIIFATNVALYRFFEGFKKFIPKWYKDSPQLDIKGFNGWYLFKGKHIPIFETFHRRIEKQILILNNVKLGTLIQYSPLDQGESGSLKEGIFYMNIQEFSENPELIDKFIKKPPEWLQNMGEEQKQRDYLRERVLIHIFQRFEYKKHEKFEGYLLKLKE